MNVPQCPIHSGLPMRWHLTRPSGFQEWRCTRDHCPQFVLTHGPIPGEQPPLYPMSQPIIYAPVGMPHELEDRARNWLFEQGYPGPTLVDTLTVPTEDNLLIIPALALLTCRTRTLDLILQCAGIGGQMVIIEPMIDLRGESPVSKGQVSALFQLAQLPEKAPPFTAKAPEPVGVPFVDRIEAPKAPKAAAPAPEYTPDQIDKARAHAEKWGSAKLVEFGKAVGLPPREAGKLLSLFINKAPTA